MKAIQPYLFFNGNCREAMEFYASALGGKLNLTTYAEGPQAPPEGGDRIMHANIVVGDWAMLMASDPMPGQPVAEGKNFSLCIVCDSREEEERLFAALSEGGKVLQPLQDTFWGAYFGMLYDKFGITWMLSYSTGQA